MRFMLRSLLGLVLMGITVGLFLAAIVMVRSASDDRDGGGAGFRGGSKERVFNVDVTQLNLTTANPVIDTFGEVISGRTLELRTASGGALTYLSDNFREGGKVFENERLFQTDPANAQTDLALKETLLSEAMAELSEANAALILANDELAAAQRQQELRDDAYERQKTLRARKVGTEAALESAALSASSAEQAVLAKRQSLANAKSRIQRAQTSLRRTEINRDQAKRMLADTEVFAGFDGTLIDVSAVSGGLVNGNERLGRLIDPSALEVSIRLSNQQFATLSDQQGNLNARKVLVAFSSFEEQVEGRILRVGAAVGEGQTGREIFAGLSAEKAQFLRVGDFVSVRIQEDPLPNVSVIPISAATSAGDVLVIGEDDRLEAGKVKILRQQADSLIIDPRGLQGKLIVSKRAPQLGAGIKVRAKLEGSKAPDAPSKTVKLTPEQQKKIREALSQNKRIPKDRVAKMLEQVDSGEIPRRLFDRMASNLGLVEQENSASGENQMVQNVPLTDKDRAKFVVFVQSNKKMPEDAKERILKQLEKPTISKKMYDRLTSEIPKGDG